MFDLITGATRYKAAYNLLWDTIPAFVESCCDPVRVRQLEIIENLHRTDLTPLERAEQQAEFIRLVEEQKLISAQVEPKSGPGRPAGGINDASRQLNISRAAAHRAVKTAAISPEAKQVARETGLDRNQTALLQIAHAQPQNQASTALEIAERKKRKGSVKNRARQGQSQTPVRSRPSQSPSETTLQDLDLSDGGSVDHFHEAMQRLANLEPQSEVYCAALQHVITSQVTASEYWSVMERRAPDPHALAELARTAGSKLKETTEAARRKLFDVVIRDAARVQPKAGGCQERHMPPPVFGSLRTSLGDALDQHCERSANDDPHGASLEAESR
jgi:ParB-like chromosome segregation protein Spo0J